MKNKIIPIITILILFWAFCIEEYQRLNTHTVLSVIEPAILGIDINNNKQIDTDEIVCIPDITSFSTNMKNDWHEFINKNKISENDVAKLGYLANNFATNTILNQKVKIHYTNKKNEYCKFANVFIQEKNYTQILSNSGFAIKNNSPINPNAYYDQLKKAEKLDLVILNHKNNKYHSIDCKYGKNASDMVVLQRNELPQNTKACKICQGKSLSRTTNLKNIPTIFTNGDIQIYLSDYTNQLKPDKNCQHNICKTVVKQINLSQHSIDIAAYGWENIPAIEKALLNAKKRGIKIRLVIDAQIPNNNYYPDYKKIMNISDEYKTDFNPNNLQHSNYLMHNKFFIFDRSKILTGSMNFSQTGFSGYNANSILIINSKQIANLYQKEFEQMLSGKFHKAKTPSINNKNIKLKNNIISVYFSPQDKIISKEIIPLVNNAKTYIYIPTFILSHEELTKSLILARKRGVDIKIIIDGTSSQQSYSKHNDLRKENIKVKAENYAGKMHMKTILIDDKYTIIGSMNFSNSGENKNDENVIILTDSYITKFYKNYFNYLWEKIPDKLLYKNIKAESKDSIGSCSDNIDNDYDGKIDSMDEGCK